MTPAELKAANLVLLQRLLDRTIDPSERQRIAALLAEERRKPRSAYPLGG